MPGPLIREGRKKETEEIKIPSPRLFLVNQFLGFYIHFQQKDRYVGQMKWLCRGAGSDRLEVVVLNGVKLAALSHYKDGILLFRQVSCGSSCEQDTSIPSLWFGQPVPVMEGLGVVAVGGD